LAYRNIRYEGKGLDVSNNFQNIVSLQDVPFEQLLAYDNLIFPTNRPTFLKLWIQQPASLTLGFVESSVLKGYGMVRKCRSGFKVGPLFADNKDIADSLFQKMLGFVGTDNQIFLDVPELNKEAVNLAQSYGMTPMFETARMYSKEAPPTPLNRVFGVTTFELG
jgi:hypothetical protein